MSSRSEEQSSINPARLDGEESKMPFGNTKGDVEIGRIQDPFQFLLHSAQNYSNKNSPSIHMVPSRIRDLNASVFSPRQVSIGPLHRENENLQAFEGQKAVFMHDLLQNKKKKSSGSPLERRLKRCVQKVDASIGRIKECYGNGIEGYSDDKLTEMMVMDGCFILEFLYKKSTGLFDKNMVIEPISMAFDLLLIENQIPFFVLHEIFKCTSSRFKPEVASLSELIIHGLVPGAIFSESQFKIKNNEVSDKTRYHILAFIHECYRPFFLDQPSSDVDISQSSDSETHCSTVETNQSPDLEKYYSAVEISDSDEDVEINGPSVPITFYSAVELHRAGVDFKPHHQPQDQQWPMGIKLDLPRFSWCMPWAMPTLRMPVLRIHNYTELVFRNLIAYEQFSPYWVPRYVTSFAVAMDLLIDNHEDVAILVNSKVLVNTIGSNEEAAKLINHMRKEVGCPHFFYNDVWKDMNDYHNKVLPRNIARLRRTYFSNPWSIIALFAGIFLFIFTMVQTYFTVNPV